MIEVHEAANIFPLDEESIPELAEDIRKNGQQVPIERLDGKVIDGRRRLKACEMAKLTPKFRDVTVSDPVSYVLSLNLHRRHLTASQRAMIGARAREVYDRMAKERQRDAGGDRKSRDAKTLGVKVPPPVDSPATGKARELVGRTVGACGSLIDRATKVIETGVPELAKAVDEGRMTVTKAAELTKQSEEEQRREAEQANGKPGRPSRTEPIEDEESEREVKGKGIIHATEAINCLRRIPKNDALRKRGFQLVKDWVRHNL